MTAAASYTRCPSWCTEHITDIDGTLLGHAHDLPSDAPGAHVMVSLGVPSETDSGSDGPAIDVQVGGDGWTPSEALKLIDSLARAVWIADPDFENPVDHDKTGLWLAVGRVVRDRMAAASLSQTEVGPMIGMSQPELSIISRGVGIRTFTLNELDALAEILGCTLAELVEEIDLAR